VVREAAVRFAGQSYTLPVPLPTARLTRADLDAVQSRFVADYRERYHRLNPDVPLELVSWRVTVSGPQPQLRLATVEAAGRNARKGSRPVYFAEAQRFVDCAVYDRFALAPGRHLRGPAVIEEPESTVVIGPGSSATIDRDGNLVATLAVARAARRERATA
jgi:N-methylhydantoinase A